VHNAVPRPVPPNACQTFPTVLACWPSSRPADARRSPASSATRAILEEIFSFFSGVRLRCGVAVASAVGFIERGWRVFDRSAGVLAPGGGSSATSAWAIGSAALRPGRTCCTLRVYVASLPPGRERSLRCLRSAIPPPRFLSTRMAHPPFMLIKSNKYRLLMMGMVLYPPSYPPTRYRCRVLDRALDHRQLDRSALLADASPTPGAQ
jgi:hypothetical protein